MKTAKRMKWFLCVLAVSVMTAFSLNVAAAAPDQAVRESPGVSVPRITAESTGSRSAQEIISWANTEIAREIAGAEEKYGVLSKLGFGDSSIPVRKICDRLESNTRNISETAERQLEKTGASYQTEIIYVYIGSNAVPVDPFKCVG